MQMQKAEMKTIALDAQDVITASCTQTNLLHFLVTDMNVADPLHPTGITPYALLDAYEYNAESKIWELHSLTDDEAKNFGFAYADDPRFLKKNDSWDFELNVGDWVFRPSNWKICTDYHPKQ